VSYPSSEWPSDIKIEIYGVVRGFSKDVQEVIDSINPHQKRFASMDKEGDIIHESRQI